MNWKRGLTRIYMVFWSLLALAGAAICVYMSFEPSEDPSSVWAAWGWWAGACLALPAVLLWIINWIASGFQRRETTKQPRAPQGPRNPSGTTKGNKFRQSFWPHIHDLETAKKATHLGAYTAFWVAGVTALFALLAILKVSTLLKAEALVDAAVFATLGFVMLKKMSRVSAVAALLCFLYERVYMAVTTHNIGSGIGGIGIIFTLFFITGVRGTFAYHRYHDLPGDEPSIAKAA